MLDLINQYANQFAPELSANTLSSNNDNIHHGNLLKLAAPAA